MAEKIEAPPHVQEAAERFVRAAKALDPPGTTAEIDERMEEFISAMDAVHALGCRTDRTDTLQGRAFVWYRNAPIAFWQKKQQESAQQSFARVNREHEDAKRQR